MYRSRKFAFILLLFVFIQCKNNNENTLKKASNNEIKHAKGLSIITKDNYSVVEVGSPWPNSKKKFLYILKKKNAVIPVEYKNVSQIQVPIKNIVLTSTTHIPSLEMLGEESKLVGFPNLNYISSEKVRNLIDSGKIKELGSNQTLNTEVLINLQPDIIMGYGLDNSNPTLDNLERNGLKVILNGDWNEQSPLGKVEWIKLFGVLFGKEKQANEIFNSIEKTYNETLKLVEKTKTKPTVFSGSLYEDKWYLPQGESWGAKFITNANGNYLWAKTKGTGSLSLSFEKVYSIAKNADIWFMDQYTSLEEIKNANPHYSQFKAFKTKNIYSFSKKKGKTGGVIYYELAPNRPDLVLKDLVKIFHPELLPNYQLYFFEKLQ
ncbi:ABC transporter substrate-binding protein [Flavobacterium sp.]|jgi:iron complex transport system substrate-binding protein|uniref:ABC transporter substrate-binding protein n=1 Tax=Flavobacterium sp. TaxID=239 RepID=UPI0037BF2789